MTATTKMPGHLRQQVPGVNSNPNREEKEAVMPSVSNQSTDHPPEWALDQARDELDGLDAVTHDEVISRARDIVSDEIHYAPHWAAITTTYHQDPGVNHEHRTGFGVQVGKGQRIDIWAYQIDHQPPRIRLEAGDQGELNLEAQVAHQIAARVTEAVHAINDPDVEVAGGLGDYEDLGPGALDHDVASSLEEIVTDLAGHNVEQYAVVQAMRRALGRIERGEVA